MSLLSFFFGERQAGPQYGDTKTVDGLLFQFRETPRMGPGYYRHWVEVTRADADRFLEKMRRQAAYVKANE